MGLRNKEQFLPYTTVIVFYNRNEACLLRGRNWVFNPGLMPWGLCDPSPLWLTFFWICHEYWRRLLRIFSQGLPNNVTHIR